MNRVSTPFLFVNPKSYLWGKESLALAQAADRIAADTGVQIFFTCPYADLRLIAEHTSHVTVTAQNMDALKPGRGMGAVLPLQWITLFTHAELKTLICGNEEIEFRDLQEIAEYAEGVDVHGDVIRRFWNVVEGLSSEDRGKLLEFVCARSRIPAPPHPPISFKIAVVKGGDEMLPQSQTCFSILKIPAYSSEEVMRKQLLYAIYNAPTMELDVQLHDAEGWE